jgi:hypothetical protein
MYLNETEKIMIEKLKSLDGWRRSLETNNQRQICIGNIKNCNDELIKNFEIKNDFCNFTKKYDIKNYNIVNISNDIEFSYMLTIHEDEYEILKNKIIE